LHLNQCNDLKDTGAVGFDFQRGWISSFSSAFNKTRRPHSRPPIKYYVSRGLQILSHIPVMKSLRMRATVLSFHEDFMFWYLIKHVDNFILYISYEILFSYATSYTNWNMTYFIPSIMLESVCTSLVLMFNYSNTVTDFVMIFMNKVII
jgi:hypothetical protein